MKNLIRNVWVCLGLMVLPFTASGQQKDNITYVPAQELLLVGKATAKATLPSGRYSQVSYNASHSEETIHKLCRSGYLFYMNSPVIKAKWMVPDNYQLPNLTRVAQKRCVCISNRMENGNLRSRDTG